jgi:hypothetical protein
MGMSINNKEVGMPDMGICSDRITYRRQTDEISGTGMEKEVCIHGKNLQMEKTSRYKNVRYILQSFSSKPSIQSS